VRPRLSAVPDVSFTNAAIVAAVAFGAPLLLGFFPSVRLPAIVLELFAGIVVGPSVLGWAEVDDAVCLARDGLRLAAGGRGLRCALDPRRRL
jgi:hypothetical protein